MKFYVDFDDCLCETGRCFSRLASELFGKDVPYEKMRYFNLQKAFSLTDEQFDRLLVEGHKPEVLLSFQETPGASAALREWIGKGHEVSVITGRPCSSFESSRAWLDQHGLQDIRLYFLDKYGRENAVKTNDFSLSLDDFYTMEFDCAVEDSTLAFRYFSHLPNLQVLVFDRPWNRDCEFPSANYHRCCTWEGIRKIINQEWSW